MALESSGPTAVVWSHPSNVSAFVHLLSTLSSLVGSLCVTILGVLLLCIWLHIALNICMQPFL